MTLPDDFGQNVLHDAPSTSLPAEEAPAPAAVVSKADVDPIAPLVSAGLVEQPAQDTSSQDTDTSAADAEVAAADTGVTDSAASVLAAPTFDLSRSVDMTAMADAEPLTFSPVDDAADEADEAAEATNALLETVSLTGADVAPIDTDDLTLDIAD